MDTSPSKECCISAHVYIGRNVGGGTARIGEGADSPSELTWRDRGWWTGEAVGASFEWFIREGIYSSTSAKDVLTSPSHHDRLFDPSMQWMW